MILRPACADDTEALARLGRDSFCAAFAHLYDPADLQAFLLQAYAPEAIAGEIADARVLYQLALDVGDGDGELAGYCKMKYPASYEGFSDAANPIVLGQLYTDPARTGQGIGAALMQWALETARERNCDAIQLSVWAENHGAQRFYRRYGFAKIADIDFWVGSHRDDEFLLELRL